MSKSIYQISDDLTKIFDAIEQNDGEMSAEIETALTITQEQLEQKGIQYAYKCLSIDAETSEIDAEIERLTKLKARNNNLKERLKLTLSNAMQHFGIQELKTATLKVNFRKSESVEVTNEDLVPQQFKKEKVSIEISKKDIKDALKRGEDVQGAELKTKFNLQIK